MPVSDRHPAAIGGLLASWAAIFAALTIGGATSSTAGYEVSFYSAFPQHFWVLIAISLCGFVYLTSVYLRDAGDRLIGLSAASGLLIVTTALQALPYLRGYTYYGRGDEPTYAGTIQSILDTGFLMSSDFYPGARVLGVSLIEYAGLSPRGAEVVGDVSVTLLYAVGSVLLARAVIGSSKWDGLAISAALVPAAGVYAPSLTHPAAFAAALVPLAAAMTFPRAGRSGVIRLGRVLLVVAFPLIHPLASIVFLAVLTVHGSIGWLMGRRVHQTTKPVAGQADLRPLTVMLAVALVAWVSGFAIYGNQLRSIRDAVIAGIPASPFSTALSTAQRSNFDIATLVVSQLEANAGVIIAVLFGVTAVLIALTVHRRRWGTQLAGLLFILGVTAALGILFIGSVVAPLHLDLWRFVHFYTIVVPVLLVVAGAVFGRGRPVAGAGLVMLVGLVSIPFAHASPTILLPSEHVPRSEVAGVQWLLKHNEDDDRLFVSSIFPLYRVVDMTVGLEERHTRFELNAIPDPPDHFGYDDSDSLRLETRGRTHALMTVSHYERFMYGDLWASADRFRRSDFRRLERDRGLSRLYVTDTFAVYRVPGSPLAARHQTPGH